MLCRIGMFLLLSAALVCPFVAGAGMDSLLDWLTIGIGKAISQLELLLPQAPASAPPPRTYPASFRFRGDLPGRRRQDAQKPGEVQYSESAADFVSVQEHPQQPWRIRPDGRGRRRAAGRLQAAP